MAENLGRHISFHQFLREKGLPIGVRVTAAQKAKFSDIQSKDSLVEALQIGVKLEQTVMLEYLYAGFSLRTYPQEVAAVIEQLVKTTRGEPEVLTSKLNSQEDAGYIMEMCRQYKYVLYEISKQEMFHLARASNILVALGETPNLRTVRIPSTYADEIPIELAKFEFSSLVTFLRNEQPYDPKEEDKSITFSVSGNDFDYMSISELYSCILTGLNNLKDENMFTHCHPKLQFHYPKSEKDLIVISHDIAVRSVQIIQDEGEGSLQSLIIFQTALTIFLKWLNSVRPDEHSELFHLYEAMEKSLNTIIQDVVKSNRLEELLKNFFQLAESYASWLRACGAPFMGDILPSTSSPSLFKQRTSELEDKHTGTGFDSPSHWESFFLMAFDYINLSNDIPGNTKQMDIKQKKFLNLSRNCAVNPGIMERNITATSIFQLTRTPILDTYAVKLAELGNLGYDLLLCLLEANFIPVSDENQEKLKITKRYYYFAYFPVMTMVIRPIGEILTYFRLNDNPKDIDKSAGMPFEMTDSENPPITTPPTADIQKFIQITNKMCQLHLLGQVFSDIFQSEHAKMRESIAPWMSNTEYRKVIQDQIMYRVGRLLKAIEVMVTQYLMQIPIDFLAVNQIHLKDYGIKPVDFEKIGHCLKPEINVDDLEKGDKHYINKLYIAVQFEGWALYPMANDPDTTDDPVGTQGRIYSFFYGEHCEQNDPLFDQYFHTQNPSEDAITGCQVTWKRRECCPQEHYDGLKVSKVSILKPTYYQQEEGTPSIEELNNLLLGCDFNKFEFLPLKQSNLKQFTNFPMLNYALTNTYVINPANFKLFSGTQGKDHYIRRADVYVDVDPVHKDKIALFYDLNVYQAAAGSKHGNAFESVQSLLLRHTAVSGGYKQWSHIEGVASINPGCVLNSVDINAATGVGSDWTDYYLVYKNRADDIWGVICKNITTEYGPNADNVIKTLEALRDINEFGFEIMLYLIITQFQNNELRSYTIILQKRLINVSKLVKSASVPGFPAPLNNQYVYNIAVNGPDREVIGKDDDRFLEFNMPDNFQLMTKLDWPIQFWVGAMDYDSTAFFIKGTWLIPFYPK